MSTYSENTMLKRVIVMMVSFALVFTSVFAFSSSKEAYAASDGTSVSSAVKLNYDEQYTKEWTENTDHLNHFAAFVVSSRGVVTLKATKPYDYEGEAGALEFVLFNENGEPVWNNNCHGSVDGFFDYYEFNIGLEPGTYFLRVKPGFSVSSGTIETQYSVKFKATQYYEVEPNEGQSTATQMTIGKVYGGNFGNGGFMMETGEHDYFKVKLTKGKTYKIALGNYDKISATSIMWDFVDPNGNDVDFDGYFSDRLDGNGRNYVYYKATTTGMYYWDFDNYSLAPVDYTFVITVHNKKTQKITGTTKFTKTGDSDDFMLKQKAKGKLTYKSSNENVCTVTSEGKVYVWNPGKATITVKAAETDMYKPATKKITIVVNPSNVSVDRVVCTGKGTLKVEWNVDSYDGHGYQIQYATNKKFTAGKKQITVKDKYASEKKIKKLKKGKKYYIKVRSYVKVGGKTYYSKWSNVMSKKVTK